MVRPSQWRGWKKKEATNFASLVLYIYMGLESTYRRGVSTLWKIKNRRENFFRFNINTCMGLVAPERPHAHAYSARTFARMGAVPPSNVTSIEKRRRGGGCQLAPRGGDTKTRQQKRGWDATPDLLLKHTDTTFTTYVWRQIKQLKHAYEILAKTHEKHLKNIVKHMQQPDKALVTYV
jgi:hypothetical protein